MSLYYKIKHNLFPIEDGTIGFIPQFRLEGRSRDANNQAGLEMRVADPLWMLGRQWQFGEFNAEDNGSPISTRANFRKEKTNSYTFPGFETSKELNGVPLEAKVEAIQVEPKDLKNKVRIGQKFEDLIRNLFPVDQAEVLVEQLKTAYPLAVDGQLDQKSLRYFNLMSGHVIGGGGLWDAIENNTLLTGDFSVLEPILERFKNWYSDLFVSSDEFLSWQPKNLSHKFSVSKQDEIILNAPDYQKGHLDWYSFDDATININPLEETNYTEMYMPVRVSFAAMPDRRLFSFEDSILDLDVMDSDTSDLVRTMISDFSLSSDNDWFTIPLEMELGELCWVNHIEVKDVFGITTRIENNESTTALSNNALEVWDAYKIRPSDALINREPEQSLFKLEEHFLYIPPVTTFKQESQPLEEILFLRDEYANMVWAVEKILRNPLGKSINGYDLHLELNGPFFNSDDNEDEETDQGLPKFKLGTPVPTNWIPYLPFHINANTANIELRRAVMIRNEDDLDVVDVEPLSYLVKEDVLTVREEAIPRAGVRIQLTKQRARGTDGKTYVWLGRKVLADRGEGSSGLRFDQLLFK